MLRNNKHLPLTLFFFLTLIYPAFGDSNDKTVAVNQELNMFENPPPETEKEFIQTKSDAEEIFSKKPADTGEKVSHAPSGVASIGKTIKEIMKPDLLQSETPKSASEIKPRVHTLDAGAEASFYRYAEPQPVGIKIQGPMIGYYADYAYRPPAPNPFNNFLTNVYFLQARYSGSRDLRYSGDGIIKNKHDDNVEFRALAGKDYYLGRDSMVTPYIGFGYRYLVDHGNGEQNGLDQFGYDRKSHYYYLPVGADVIIDLPHDWEIDPNVEYDVFLSGWQKSYLSNVGRFTGFSDPDIVNHQDHGFGVRAAVKFLKKGPVVDYYVEPFIRYWSIEDSKLEFAVIDGQAVFGGEPKNNTLEVGSRFGIQF